MAEGFRGGRLFRFDQVGSTMEVARDLDGPEVFTVVARSQTAGRGRFDRPWLSPPSGGLYLTASIPWSRPLSQAPLVSMGTALALARLASQLGCPRIALKWPNDLLLSDRKAAGILAEMHHPSPGVSRLLVGVGVNVSIPEDTLAKVGQPATSLSVASGRELDPEQVLRDFLSLWTEVDWTLERSGFPSLVEEYRGFTDLPGRRFRLEGAGGTSSVVRVVAVQEDGSLQVEHGSTGLRQSIHGGELVPLDR
ncbi:MAG TPA: biotin--[acetyl-CoA-carboxylase] ligase [Fibrobacteria bacterium]|nr:biotin--[acetyl-CoA-carboxylase] ligase [Fibrobacteria bacterium]